MSAFDTELVAVIPEFLEVFGEAIEYWPLGAIDARVIKAIIERKASDDLIGIPYGKTLQITIWVANDSKTGIASTELDRGGDMVKLPVKTGLAAEKRPIVGLISEDAGMLHLEVN